MNFIIQSLEMQLISIKINKYSAAKTRFQILVRCIGSLMILYQNTLHKRYVNEDSTV